ncbi:MAG: TonB-dependent receptor, partial [Prevotellaceae bacterium]|nr:TonB-dependent receptor [Prevotellaceae bacterium]
MKQLFFFNRRSLVASCGIVAASLFAGITLYAQTRNLSGFVTDTQGESLPGAVVNVKGSTSAVAAGADGRFTLALPADAATVEVSYMGYVTQTVDVRGKNEIEVTLQEQVSVFDEVVVIGYDTQKKVNLTGSVQVVAGSDLTKRSAPNTSAALQGLAAGMSVVQSTGRPGADGGNITIRGRGSINTSTSPLILIDNVEGDVNAIDMSIVESISVL